MNKEEHAQCTLVIPQGIEAIPFEELCIEAQEKTSISIQKYFPNALSQCTVKIHKRSSTQIRIHAIISGELSTYSKEMALSACFTASLNLFLYYESKGLSPIMQGIQITRSVPLPSSNSTRTTKAPLYALILVGGKSSRMGRDKSILSYHGISYLEKTRSLLNKFCNSIYLSLREEQKNLKHVKDFPHIQDTFLNLGPLSGILSALYQYKDVAWLVLPSDLPLIQTDTIEMLITARNTAPENALATSYYNVEDRRYEPLCTIYEPESLAVILQLLGQGISCPSAILKYLNTYTIPIQSNALYNVNTPEDYQEVCTKLL